MLYQIALGHVHLYLHTEYAVPTLTRFSQEHMRLLPEEVPAQKVKKNGDAPRGGVDRLDARIICTDTMPVPEGAFCGTRGLVRCYRGARYSYAVLPSDAARCGVTVAYSPDFTSIRIFIDAGQFAGALCPVEELALILPMSEMLARFNMQILHASRIRIADKAILFTAPSGTGKTTAARLWEKHAGAHIISNDRVLISGAAKGFQTYGYLLDGEEPVSSTAAAPAGAIVLLRQGPENVLHVPAPFEAAHLLMSQTVADAWDTGQLTCMRMLWLDLIERIPVYALTCRPDEDAVRILQERLRADGVW